MRHKWIVAIAAMGLVLASEAVAVTWSAPIDLSAPGQDAYLPQVAGSADGTRLTSVWRRSNGSNLIIQARTSTDSGKTWSTPVNLSAAGQNADHPQVTGSADGTRLASVWRRFNGSKWIIQARTSTDSGATWSAPVDLSAAGQDAWYPQITGSADGSILASVWSRSDGSKWIIQGSTSADSGKTWSAPDDLSLAGQDAYGPQVTVSADGTSLASVWSRSDGSNSIIQAFNTGPAWLTWTDLSAAGQNADCPQVTGSADGTRVTVVWYRWNGSKYIIQASTSADSGKTWSAPDDLSLAGQDAYTPQVTGSADGSRLTSVWWRSNGVNFIIQASTSSDSGATWSTPVNVSAAGWNADEPQVTGSADGGKLTSVWRRFNGSNYIIQASTSTDSGATWSTPVDLSVAGQHADGPQVTGSADGTRLASVWSRCDGSKYIIQAATGKIAPTPAGMFYVIPNREGGGAVIFLE